MKNENDRIKTSDDEIMRRPAIKSGIGNWNYYVSTMTFNQIANFVKMPDEIYTSKKLSDMIQRTVTKNTTAIVEYLKNDAEHFFNALVLAVYGGDPMWYEGVFEYKEDLFCNIGVLEFNKQVKIFPVDGQHRLAAIKEIVSAGEETSEEIPVIFIAHQCDANGVKRTRRLFTSLNRYAKPVKLNEIIALDEDDIVAITTRRLVEETEELNDSRILISPKESIPESDSHSFSNIITLYNCNNYLLQLYLKNNAIKVKLNAYKRFRRSDEENEAFFQYAYSFWKEIIAKDSAMVDYYNNGNESLVRSSDGGYLLFRPAGLRAFVEATCKICMKYKVNYSLVLEHLRSFDLILSHAPWERILWDGRMRTENRPLVATMIEYLFDPDMLKSEEQTKLKTRYAQIKGYDLSIAKDSELVENELKSHKLGSIICTKSI